MPRLSLPRNIFLLIGLSVFALLFSYAWVTEDAFITFRVVDHFIKGYGLRWNIDERVQVYTHPLWMLLHIPFYAIFGNIFFVTIGLSAFCLAAAIYFLATSATSSYAHKTLLILLPLALSLSCANYMVSGLETPLTCLLVVLFFHQFLREGTSPYRLLLIASLCILTRFDNALLLLPALLWLAAKHARTASIPRAIAAFSPFILWCVFCLFYYGFIFPNTKYAKLGTGIATSDYIQQGLYYAENFFYFDPASALVVIAALLLALRALLSPERRRRETPVMLMGAGIALYIVYIVYIGGDFMAGRFFTAPFVLGVLVFHTALCQTQKLKTIGLLLLAAFAAGQYWFPSYYPNRTNTFINHGIVVEREYYAGTNTLFVHFPFEIRSEPNFFWVQWGRLAYDDPKIPTHVAVFKNVGMYGFYSDPRLIIIDTYALADPLLARLPIPDPHRWRIGHFLRDVPPGYVLARETGFTGRMPAQIRALYEPLRLITSGDLWDMNRLRAILYFNNALPAE